MSPSNFSTSASNYSSNNESFNGSDRLLFSHRNFECADRLLDSDTESAEACKKFLQIGNQKRSFHKQLKSTTWRLRTLRPNWTNDERNFRMVRIVFGRSGCSGNEFEWWRRAGSDHFSDRWSDAVLRACFGEFRSRMAETPSWVGSLWERNCYAECANRRSFGRADFGLRGVAESQHGNKFVAFRSERWFYRLADLREISGNCSFDRADGHFDWRKSLSRGGIEGQRNRMWICCRRRPWHCGYFVGRIVWGAGWEIWGGHRSVFHWRTSANSVRGSTTNPNCFGRCSDRLRVHRLTFNKF